MKNKINLPFWMRLILFLVWPLLATFIIVFVAIIIILIWPTIPFKATITFKN